VLFLPLRTRGPQPGERLSLFHSTSLLPTLLFFFEFAFLALAFFVLIQLMGARLFPCCRAVPHHTDVCLRAPPPPCLEFRSVNFTQPFFFYFEGCSSFPLFGFRFLLHFWAVRSERLPAQGRGSISCPDFPLFTGNAQRFFLLFSAYFSIFVPFFCCFLFGFLASWTIFFLLIDSLFDF